MDNSDPPFPPSSPRATLKLKVAPRKAPVDDRPAAVPRPQGKSNLKPGAHWSDEYKKRMQADMDELTSK